MLEYEYARDWLNIVDLKYKYLQVSYKILKKKKKKGLNISVCSTIFKFDECNDIYDSRKTKF